VGHEATQDRKELLEDHAICPDMRKKSCVAFGSMRQETQRVGGIGRTDALVVVKIQQLRKLVLMKG